MSALPQRLPRVDGAPAPFYRADLVHKVDRATNLGTVFVCGLTVHRESLGVRGAPVSETTGPSGRMATCPACIAGGGRIVEADLSFECNESDVEVHAIGVVANGAEDANGVVIVEPTFGGYMEKQLTRISEALLDAADAMERADAEVAKHVAALNAAVGR